MFLRVAALAIAGLTAGCSAGTERLATPPTSSAPLSVFADEPSTGQPASSAPAVSSVPETDGSPSELADRDEFGDVATAAFQLAADKQALIDDLDPAADCSTATSDTAPAVQGEGTAILQVVRIVGGCLVVETTAVAERDIDDAIIAAAAAPDVVAADRGSFASTDHAADPSTAAQQWWIDDLRVSELDALVSPASAPRVRVALIDTGIDDGHPDLEGLVVDRGSWTTSLNDQHGTHLAGIIAAKAGNGEAGRGIASSNVDFLDISFEGRNPPTVASMIWWAVDRGAQVINMSFCELEVSGSPCLSTPNKATLAAVEYAKQRDVLMFASGGNCGPSEFAVSPQCGGVEHRDQFPAGYNGVIAVGAYGKDGAVARLSTRNVSVDVSAPGVPVTSTGFYPSPGHYSTGGTSQATAMVSGAAATLLAYRPDIPPRRVLFALVATARDSGAPGWDAEYGSGRIDPLAAARWLDANHPFDVGIETTSTTVAAAQCVRSDIDFAAVRRNATTTAEQVGVLAAGQCDVALTGESVPADQSGEMWFEVDLNGTTGWSAARLFDVATLDRDLGLDVAFSQIANSMAGGAGGPIVSEELVSAIATADAVWPWSGDVSSCEGSEDLVVCTWWSFDELTEVGVDVQFVWTGSTWLVDKVWSGSCGDLGCGGLKNG